MPISDDELIAYLLGDANPQQRARVEMGLVGDENVRVRFSELRIVLGQLDSLQRSYEPPADLFESTMARIDEADAATPPAAAVPSQTSYRPLLSCTAFQGATSRASRGTWDSVALALCLAMLLSLFFPTVLGARNESRKAQCAHNMKGLGRGLLDYASLDPQGRFPAVALTGPRSFAGIWAVCLRDLGYVRSPSELWCPSLGGSDLVRGQLLKIPSLVQLETLEPSQLEMCRNEAGGDFSYPMGVIEDGEIVAPRCEGRSNFPILGDLPIAPGSTNVAAPHDGRGVNLFFEDGHVGFIRVGCFEDEVRDNPFCNLLRELEVGLNPSDASLGPSHFKPLGND